MNVTFPIFVRMKDCGEVSLFSSAHDFQHQVEKIDIENREYEAWDSNGIKIELALQDPLWIKVEPSTVGVDVDHLRNALIDFGSIVGINLPKDLPISSFAGALGKIKAEQEKRMQEKSFLRRFFAR